jgi:hypothetical protein
LAICSLGPVSSEFGWLARIFSFVTSCSRARQKVSTAAKTTDGCAEDILKVSQHKIHLNLDRISRWRPGRSKNCERSKIAIPWNFKVVVILRADPTRMSLHSFGDTE